MKALKKTIALLQILALAFIFSGCKGPLEVKYDPKTIGQFKSGEPYPVVVAEFSDKRAAGQNDPRTIGKIESTVADITGDKLTLSEDVTDIVERAYGRELALAGFTVVPERENARYVISGEVREFTLDIASRDKIAIEISTTVSDAKTNEPIWSGTDSERDERFAGVMGNSRSTVSNYIAASLQKVIRRSIASAGQMLSAKPQTKPVQDNAASPVAGKGKAVISAVPERSKAYIDGIYYGLTPLSIEMPPGIYEVTIKQKGFKAFTEKISIRDGASTEVEAELEPE